MSLKNVEQHPKDTATGGIFWGRDTIYVCGDRARGTVILVTPDGVMEMTPERARQLAEEMGNHAADVSQLLSEPDTPSAGSEA